MLLARIINILIIANHSDFRRCTNDTDCKYHGASMECNTTKHECQRKAGYALESMAVATFTNQQNCSTDSKCGRYEFCDRQKCACKYGFDTNSSPTLICLSAKKCDQTSDCHGIPESYCINQRCGCTDVLLEERDGNDILYKCRKGKSCDRDSKCGIYEICEDQMCVCKYGTEMEQPICKRGKPCVKLSDCNDIPGSYCGKGECSCNAEDFPQKDSNQVLYNCKKNKNSCSLQPVCPTNAFCNSEKRCVCLSGFEMSTQFDGTVSCYRERALNLIWIVPVSAAVMAIIIFTACALVLLIKWRNRRRRAREGGPSARGASSVSDSPNCGRTSSAYDNCQYTHDDQPPAYDQPPPSYEQAVAASRTDLSTTNC